MGIGDWSESWESNPYGRYSLPARPSTLPAVDSGIDPGTLLLRTKNEDVPQAYAWRTAATLAQNESIHSARMSGS